MKNEKIRNIAIIAHVDHGKTTLVDHLLQQSGAFQEHKQMEDRLMDSMELEKERGITIAAKNCSYTYEDVKVNIVDTPGHSDFGGEVERILDMVDGAILLVDASEGPLPQTRFVLKRALEKNLKLIVCINKIDRSDSRINEVLDEVFDLFIDLDATEEQADFDVIYAIAKDGIATEDPDNLTDNMKILFDWIKNKMPAPEANIESDLQMLVSNIDYNSFVGRLGIGRVRSGKLKVGDEVLLHHLEKPEKMRVTALYSFDISSQVAVEELAAGDIGVVAGMKDVTIGDCFTPLENGEVLPRIEVEEPSVGVMVMVNDGPFAGLDGKNVTSRKIKERLEKELLYNVSIRVEDTDSPDTWKVMGRGELQLAVLAEQMRREGFEFLISKPEVIYKKDEKGNLTEPMEDVVVDVDENYVGAVTKKLGERKGILMNMDNKGSGRTRVEFLIPARGLIGYRSEFLTDTKGTGLLNSHFAGYEEFKGSIPTRITGAMLSDRKGKATGYSLNNLESRGRLIIRPGVEVYGGMVIGEVNKGITLEVNVTREKKLSNVRASGTDDAVKLAPIKDMTLEESLEWISERELIEVTPSNIRIRSRWLDPHVRKKHELTGKKD
mgnify:CR=1 FL=1|jgi:GTP-binding protein